MKKILLMLFPFFVYGATGDITSVEVLPNGISLGVTIEGVDTGGTWRYYFNSNHAPSDSTPYIDLLKWGYDQTGQRVRNAVRSYVDTIYRKNYPLNGYDSCYINGSDTAFVLHLSVPVDSADSIVGCFFPDSLYTESGNSSSEYTGSITNSSEISNSLFPVYFKWTWVGQMIYDTSFYVYATTYHPSSDSGRIIECVIFSASDGDTTIYDTVITASRGLDNQYAEDSLCIIEYEFFVDVANFTKDSVITVNAKVFPRWGDSLWTGDGVNTWPTEFHAPQTYLYAEPPYCWVNKTTGNDGTGVVVLKDDFDTASPPLPFRTMAGAINGIRAYRGTADITGGLVYIKDDSPHNIYGASITAGTYSSYFIEFKSWPGDTAEIDSQLTTFYFPVNAYVKFTDILWSGAQNVNYCAGENGIWMDNCIDNRTSGFICGDTRLVYFTNCKFNTRAQNIPSSTQNGALALARGNTYSHSAIATVVPFAFFANVMYNPNSIKFKFDFTGMGIAIPEGCMIGWNYIYSNIERASGLQDSSFNHGPLFIGNILEQITSTGPLLTLATVSTSRHVNSVGYVNNTFVGQRLNMAYNDGDISDSLNYPTFDYWFEFNNIFHQRNTITDRDAHGTPAEPGNKRFGNWYVDWGTMCKSNVYVIWSASASDAYGVNYHQINISTIGQADSVNDSIKFVDDNSWIGSNDGWGDYHLAESSPAIGFSRIWQLPYDLDGYSRTEDGAVGAYGYEEGGDLPPTVTVDPVQLHDTLGQTDTVTVTVTGTAPFTYQWQIYNGGWADTTDETNDSLFYLVTLDKSGDSIRVIVTNGEGSDTSAAIEIAVLWVEPPTITTDPQDTTLNTGRTAHFYIEYTGSPCTFQWQDSSAGGWANISGATDSTLDTTANNAITGYRYRCIATNDSASDTSIAATLTVDPFTVSFDITGSGAASGDGDYDSLDTAFIELTPAANYHCVSDSLDTIVVTKDTTYQVIFGLDSFTVTINDGVNVDLTALNGTSIGWGQVCSVQVVVDAGYAYKINGGDFLYSNDTLLITVGGDTTITGVSYLIPVVDTIKALHRRDALWKVARVLDTCTIYSVGATFGTEGDSSAIFVNSTGTIRGTIVQWTADSVRYQIPAGTPSVYYRTRVRSVDEILSAAPSSNNFYVKTASR